MSAIKAGMLVRIANREDPDRFFRKLLCHSKITDIHSAVSNLRQEKPLHLDRMLFSHYHPIGLVTLLPDRKEFWVHYIQNIS